MEHAPGKSELIEGEIYTWKDLTGLLGNYNPDAPDIVLPGDDKFIIEQARRFVYPWCCFWRKSRRKDFEYFGHLR
jgi:hypothetical protein